MTLALVVAGNSLRARVERRFAINQEAVVVMSRRMVS